MRKLIAALFTIILGFAIFLPPAYAAQIISADEVFLTSGETDLSNLYLFGKMIRVDAPVSEDLVAAGGDIRLNNSVSGGVLAAGGDLSLRGNIGQTARVAGGNILIDSHIEQDLVITGGSAVVTRNASIGGDVIFLGGHLTLEGPVAGKIILGGGDIILNGSIGGDVSGQIGELTLGPEALINGNLLYSSSQQAEIKPGAVVKGETKFHQEKSTQNEDEKKGFLASLSLYKLVTDIVLSVLFIFFFRRVVKQSLLRMNKAPFKSGVFGFAFLLLTPLASIFLLLLIWLGLASFLFYGMVLILGLFLMKVFLGWKVMQWWETRKRKDYILDWRAGVFGPLLLYLIFLIPVIGWFVVAILFFMAIGALCLDSVAYVQSQRTTKAGKK